MDNSTAHHRLEQAIRDADYHFGDFMLGAVTCALLMLITYKLGRSRIEAYYHSRFKQRAATAFKDINNPEELRRALNGVELPTWMIFPDFERVGWASDFLNQLWPYLAAAGADAANKQLDPLLDASKPDWVQDIRFTRFDLGDVAPQVGGVKTYTQGAAANEAMFEFDFMWAGNQRVDFLAHLLPRQAEGQAATASGRVMDYLARLLTVKVGLSDMILNGRARVALSPLMSEFPCAGAMHVAFTEMPHFSFDLRLAGGNTALLPGLEEYLKGFMKEQLLAPYVLPQRVRLPLINETLPGGMIRAEIIQAVKVPKLDVLSDSDVFVKAYVREDRPYSTQVKQNKKNPAWGEAFSLLVADRQQDVLTCVLCDHDLFNPAREIGWATLPLEGLQPGEERDVWLPVTLAKKAKREGAHSAAEAAEAQRKDSWDNVPFYDPEHPAPPAGKGAGQGEAHDGQAAPHDVRHNEADAQMPPHTPRTEERQQPALNGQRVPTAGQQSEEGSPVSGAQGAHRQMQVEGPAEEEAAAAGASQPASVLGQIVEGVQAAVAPVLSSIGVMDAPAPAAPAPIQQDTDKNGAGEQGTERIADPMLPQGQVARRQLHPENQGGLDGEVALASGDMHRASENGHAKDGDRHRGVADEEHAAGSAWSAEGSTDEGGSGVHTVEGGSTAKPRSRGASPAPADRNAATEHTEAHRQERDECGDSSPRAEHGAWQHASEPPASPGSGRSKSKCQLHLRLTYVDFSSKEKELAAQHRTGKALPPRAKQDNPALKYLIDSGVLYVRVRKAEGLKRTPWYQGGYKMHTVATVKVGQHEKRTGVAKARHGAPTFDETLEILLEGEEVDAQPGMKVTVEVWDTHWRNTLKGRVQVPLQEIIAAQHLGGVYHLDNSPSKGSLHLSLQWLGVMSTDTGS